MPVSELSGGERARVYIANLIRKPADLLLLDEPGNDLDIPTLEMLESSLGDYPGSILLITHDRHLLEELSSFLLCFDGNGGFGFFSDYHQWLKCRGNSSDREAPILEGRSSRGGPDKKQRREIDKIAKRIEKAEAKVSVIKESLEDPAITSNSERLSEIFAELQRAEGAVEELYIQWEELEEEV